MNDAVVQLLGEVVSQQSEIIRLLTLIYQDSETYKRITKHLAENLYGQ